ncbi:hypothetical protein PAEPH01_2675 [Pancytospora epiphaga]|nr:hypothetical protein PAEPH01_2675 [Pancytospora epiphaga]
MECIITPDKALLLDKLLRFYKASSILFDSTAGLLLQVVTPDLSQLKCIRPDDTFFSYIKLLNIVVSIPFQKFHIGNMKSLKIIQREYTTTLEYIFEEYKYTKVIDNIEGEVFDPEFEAIYSLNIDLSALRRALKGTKVKQVRMEIRKDVRVFYEGTEIVLDSPVDCIEPIIFRIDLEGLKSIFNYMDLYTDYSLSFSDSMECLNATFRGPESVTSIYVGIHSV